MVHNKIQWSVARVQQIAHKNIISTHCFIHYEQFPAKEKKKNLFCICMKIVNFIRDSAANSRIFKTICEEMVSVGFKKLSVDYHE